MKVQANNYSNAVKEMEAFDKNSIHLVPEEINESDATYNVVVLVAKIHNIVKKEYDVKVNIQQYDNRGLLKIAEKYSTQGYDKVIVLHKAEQKAVQANTANMQVNSPTLVTEELKSQLKAELRAELQAEMANKQEVGAPSTDQSGANDEGKQEGKNLEDMTVRELNDFAAENNINLDGLSKKEDIYNAISVWKSQQK